MSSPPPRAPDPAAAAPKERIGDRVERAIEDRADVERVIERGEAQEPPRRALLRRSIWLVVTGVSLYLVAPSVLDVLASWSDIRRFGAGWLAAMLVLQILALACLWALQAVAMHTRRWYPVITSQLAGNALAKVAPGGGAVGAALQYKMLVQAGLRRTTAVSGLTAANLLTFAVVLALPMFAIPAIVRGAVDRSLVEVTIVGAVVFLVLLAVAAVCIATDEPLRWIGRVVQGVRNRLRRGSAPLTGLPDRLLRERDRIVGTLGPRWKRALLATTGRWAFDYATLVAALAAVGSRPRPSLVLLAFCAAQLLAQVPITPGGLGLVEAGLTAMLGLAGVSAGDAVLATFAYRLFSYWLPLPAGAVGIALHRRRYPART
jgi:putative heme transporter